MQWFELQCTSACHGPASDRLRRVNSEELSGRGPDDNYGNVPKRTVALKGGSSRGTRPGGAAAGGHLQAEAIDLAGLRERQHQITGRRGILKVQYDQQVLLLSQRQTAQQVLLDVSNFCERVRTGLDRASFADRQRIVQLLVHRIIGGEGSLGGPAGWLVGPAGGVFVRSLVWKPLGQGCNGVTPSLMKSLDNPATLV